MNLEELINNTYKNIAMYTRDLKLNDDTINKYKKELIITDPSFIDMTFRLGGINKKFNTRFIILSNHANDMQELEQDTKWGLFVINAFSFFKVLDTFKINNISFIVLLHIQKNYINFFEDNSISLDESLVMNAKNIMNTLISTQPDIRYDDDDFYKRVNFAIGIKDNGDYFKTGEIN